MAVIQVVEAGVVVNTILVEDGSTIANNQIDHPDGSIFPAPAGATFMEQAGAGIGWALSGGVLVPPAPVAVTHTKDQLVEYANRRQWDIATGGHSVTIGGTAYRFPTDEASLGLMTGKVVRLQIPGAPTSIDWQLPSGYLQISASDFVMAAANIADFMQSTFEALKPVLASIKSGAVTTTDQIDAASWPTP